MQEAHTRPERSRRDLIDARRRQGRFYTPDWLAAEMLEGCFTAPDAPQHPRILDPACGEGAFLLPAYDRLQASGSPPSEGGAGGVGRSGSNAAGSHADWQHRLALIRDCLFGVDIDERAIEVLRAALLVRVDPPADRIPQAEAIIAANIRCGDALTGADFGSADTGSTQGAALGTLGAGARGVPQMEIHKDEAPLPQHPGCPKPHPGCFPVGCIDWSREFPTIAATGGFDLVIGNPPYLRELRARERFDRVARSPLGRKWRQARMDFWHYFVHRGLDLLRPGGRLAFVVNGYWTASTGASKLVRRLQEETALEAIRLLDDEPVFADVAGRHLTFRLRKQPGCEPCRVEDRTGSFHVAQCDLYQHGRLIVTRPSVHPEITGPPLRDVFLVRQGIAENPPVITARHVREFPGEWRVGEGVFVLTADEVDSLGLSPRERSLLKPYFRASTVGRYAVPKDAGTYLLYLTRATVPDLTELPRLERHLDRFRPLLERRREVARGRIAWWHLHWPREERLFNEPRILAVQMGETPRFTVARHPTYVGFAVNVIVPRQGGPSSDDVWPLDAVCGLLNSAPAARWFERHAKHRGIRLDISGEVLSRFPLPDSSTHQARELAGLVEERLKRPDESASLDSAINDLADAWYLQSSRITP